MRPSQDYFLIGDTVDHWLQLIKVVREHQDGDPSRCCLVTLEEFFIGNSDYGSIGPNIEKRLGPETFYSVLKTIRQESSVQDIFIGISEVVEDRKSWPFADRVHVIASASIEVVAGWLNPLQPDELVEGWGSYEPTNMPEKKVSYHLYTALWD